MGKRKTQEDFVIKANLIHKERYRYTKVNYVSTTTKVTITCHLHGDFLMKPNNHISNKQGCPKCGLVKNAEAKRKDNNWLRKQGELVYGKGVYDYSEAEYIKSIVKVKIKCNKHNHFFYKRPNNHINMKEGCPICAMESLIIKRSKSKEEFVRQAEKIHGKLYDYTDSIYTKHTEKVSILCKKHNSIFNQSPGNHLSGKGCPKCGKLTAALHHTSNTEEFIVKAKVVHKNKYSYEKSVYTGSKNNVIIYCNNHKKDFEQKPKQHLRGHGCPECHIDKLRKVSSTNPVGWNYHSWILAATASENFDSFKVYIIRCWNENEEFYKIGRTFQTVKKRFGAQAGAVIKYNYEVIKIFGGSAEEMCKLEKRLQKENKEHKYLPLKDFGGKYECFSKINKICLS